METKENALSAFSDETLNEMAMENVEGGGTVDLNVSKCGLSNNCSGGNCIAGCGVAVPPKEEEKTVLSSVE